MPSACWERAGDTNTLVFCQVHPVDMALTRFERFQAWILRTFKKVLLVLYQLLASRPSDGSSKKLAPITNPLLMVSGIQLAQKIRLREVTCVEVVQAYIDRIEEVNPLINAIVKDRFSAALQEAAQVDRLIDEEEGGEDVLKDRLPLLGVPFTVKAAFALQGMPYSAGLVSRKGVISGVDAPPLALLKRAGAIPLGITNCSELCMWFESHNRLFGITRNPYDMDRIVGGSTGGEACILASGGSVIGVGSDIGGSIRMPAFFNGIFGHKTSPGIVSNDGQFPPSSGLEDDYLSTGPMCRYAEDLLPMLQIMAGPNAQRLSLSSEVDLRKLRFFSVPHDGGSVLVSPVDRELLQIQRRVVEHLEADLGVKVQELRFPQLKYSFQIWSTFMNLPDKDGKPPTPFVDHMADHGKKVWPLWEMVKSFLGLSSHTVAAIGLALMEMVESSEPDPFILKQKEEFQKELEEVLGTDGVLLYPSHPLIAPKHHHPIFTPFNFAYTGIFNILGLPVTQCPLGLSQGGLPLGVQVVSGKYLDRQTLATALYLEKAFGGWRDPGSSS
ncbi:fatty-acid amide hydrolase 2-B isoform X1 [Anguilla rostrata]|uniref:fatty-acid amide hydrolase 2-B isoform X1 n=2 Tax=Anguilla rostrata TaxID=7938 RepID=UPI0030D193E9